MATRFRYVKSSRLSYKRQGLVWFQCQNYKRLSKREQEKIRRAAERAGGEHAAAILDYMTTDASWRWVCVNHFISDATLQRIRKKFYEEFAK